MTQKVSPPLPPRSSSAASSAAAASIGIGATGFPRTPAAPPAYTPAPQYPWIHEVPKRPATRRPSPSRAASRGGAGSGCWIFVLLAIFFVRACITSTSHWNAGPATPVRPMPSHPRTPPRELDDGLERFPEHHTDPFDRRYFPDDPPAAPDSPAPPAPAEPPPPDRPTE
jgi:hypothetical protein